MRPKVIATMIVKNEAHCIARCIEHVRPLVDGFAIIDTGSTDDTYDVAKRAVGDVPQYWGYADWKGYGPTRNVAMAAAESLAKAMQWDVAYALGVDADDIWSGERPELTGDAHAVWCHRPELKWATTRYLRLFRGIRYEHVLHEYPAIDGKPVEPASMLDCVKVTATSDGATWRDPDKYLEHARLISKALVDDPANRRYRFYLAQSYRDYGDYETAAALYLQRAAMGPGDEPEQVYVSFLNAGRCFVRLGDMKRAEMALLNARKAHPGRREAMADLARFYAVQAATSPVVGTLFVETGESVGDVEEAA